MLNFIATIIIVATTIVVLNAVISSLPVGRRPRLLLALAVGSWTGLAVALASAGALAADAGGAPVVGAMVAIPLILTAAVAFLFPAARKVMLSLPLPLLVGLNVTRVGGVFFLLLAAAGELAGPFPQSAGWGDILTGVFAIPALGLATRSTSERDGLLYLWNWFGAFDLFAAVTLGTLSANGSPLQLIHAGVGSAAVQHLPWSLIPTVLVPAYLILHGIIFAQLRARSAERAGNSAARAA
jgi:hypothetical protein